MSVIVLINVTHLIIVTVELFQAGPSNTRPPVAALPDVWAVVLDAACSVATAEAAKRTAQ